MFRHEHFDVADIVLICHKKTNRFTVYPIKGKGCIVNCPIQYVLFEEMLCRPCHAPINPQKQELNGADRTGQYSL